MDSLNILAAFSSIVGLIFSMVAAIQAGRASRAASAAREAALARSLADELQLACSRGEQLVDFLQHCRYKEASLRVNELVWSISELPHRHSPDLSSQHKNTILTSRQQLLSIVEAIEKNDARGDSLDKEQIMTVARRVTMSLREILGNVRSNIEHGEQ